MKNMGFIFLILLLNIIFNGENKAQSGFYEPINLDTVNWSFDDFGKMWTFDNVPVSDFKEAHGFTPTKEWLLDVQKSALQFGGGCSAAFVSEDGLIMTNHHCGRNQLKSVERDGENILRDGFYAETLNEERKIEHLYVDQLIHIEDVTDKIKKHMSKGFSENEKVDLREAMKDSLISVYNKETGFLAKIVTLYHGGKYSLYGYKRYNDIRLVMAPDFQIAATGWDWDNFTYPRYELDFMFYRAYDEEGNPVKSNNFYKWSKNGAQAGESVFVIGRPGSTERLYSISQLEYLRDYVYPMALISFNAIYDAYYRLYQIYPDDQDLLNNVMRWGNSRKSYAGRLAGLKNEYIMKKKKSFQEHLQSKIYEDPDLRERYGEVWKIIDSVIIDLSRYALKNRILRASRYIKPSYYTIAEELIKIVEQNNIPENEREAKYRKENIDSTISTLFDDNFDSELNDALLSASIDFLNSVLDSLEIEVFSMDMNIIPNAEEMKSSSKILNKDVFSNYLKLNIDEIKKLKDPFLEYVFFIKDIEDEISDTLRILNNSLSVYNQMLGEAVYAVFGDKIPPDATSTLRISDGVIKGYEYNGTIAPSKTTYFGLWDRYESFGGETYPWGLHERWKIPPEELDLSVDVGFASTNDIVGGNSGSSAINVNKEVVGLVHDGNIESLAGHTIFLEENNRTVATDSHGLMESLKYIYRTGPLVNELLNGKISGRPTD